MPVGHPIMYKPEFCDVVIERGKKGGSIYCCAADCGVTAQTLYEWKKRYPEFKTALENALNYSKAFIARKMIENIGNPQFNAKTCELYAKYVLNLRESSNDVVDNFADAKTVDEQINLILKSGALGKISSKTAQELANVANIRINALAATTVQDQIKDIKTQIEEFKK